MELGDASSHRCEVGQLVNDEVTGDRTSMSGYDDVRLADLLEQECQGGWPVQREAAGPVHGWARFLEDITDDPGLCVGDVDDEVVIGVTPSQRKELDRATPSRHAASRGRS